MVERTGGNRPADKHEESGIIRNIIFDLGNVLIRFSPEDFLDKINVAGTLKDTILTDIFASEEWLLLDKAELSLAEAAERISSRSSLGHELISSVFSRREGTLEPIPQNVCILPELKKRGFKLFYLSNFPFDMWEHINALQGTEYSFFRFFDGGIISAEVGCAKPDHAIYRHLLEKYNLEAGECLFIDDLSINVDAAQTIGMKGIFTGGAVPINGLIKEALKIS
ncbi:MAG TPA: HAD family phosphatase [Bacteroidales bacterium]|nr:HAD family phosphatase [Bacteroidales bacterium]